MVQINRGGGSLSSQDAVLASLSDPRRHDSRSIPWLTLAFVALGVGVVAYIAFGVREYTRAQVDLVGIVDGEHLQPDVDEPRLVVATFDDEEAAARSVLMLDGETVPRPEFTQDDPGPELTEFQRVWQVPVFEPGPHRLSLSVSRPLFDPVEFTWDFTVDSDGPLVAFDPQPAVDPWSAVTVTGRVEDASLVRTGDEEIDLGPDGTFSFEFARPPLDPVCVWARDRAGNSTEVCVPVEITYPDVKAIHIGARDLGEPAVRERIEQLLDNGTINTVQIDLKDEEGEVGYDSQLALPIELGAVRSYYDLDEAVASFQERGAHVIGRIVAFNDPIYSNWAWTSGRREQVIQDPGGGRLGRYGGAFLNFAHPEVHQYVLDIALEGARAGVDDVMYDYIRRPEGSFDNMVVPGLDTAPDDAIVDFLERSHRILRAEGVYQGAAVFGIAATRPESVAQDVPRMSEHLDYVSPMLYPSHWGDGEFGLPEPDRAPYEIIAASMAAFVDAAEPTGTFVVPWLQDFTLGEVPYGQAEVTAQVRAAEESGGHGWLLWNARSRYSLP